MAFNFKVFKTRALTAGIFAAVMLAGLFVNFWSFLLLITIIHFGCWFEYLKMTESIYQTRIDIIIKYFFSICAFTLFIILSIQHVWVDIWINIFGIDVSLKIFLWLLLFAGLLIITFQNKMIPSGAKKMMLLGFLYITIPLTAFVSLKEHFSFTSSLNSDTDDSFVQQNNLLSIILPCAVILSIWINDTMAYIVGSLIGKTPFSKVSPKKTWEGTIGGGLICIMAIGLIGYILPAAHILPLRHWLCIAGICAVFGPIGDLLESKLKRMAGIKDSGSFMPGHGGFLDRFDSLLVSLPFVWLYAMLFIF